MVYSQPRVVQSKQNDIISRLRDSLDAITFEIPRSPKVLGTETVVRVDTQEDWDSIVPALKVKLDSGYKNIVIRFGDRTIEFGRERKVVIGWHYPDARIWFDGRGAKLVPYGISFSFSDEGAVTQGDFYSFPYKDFSLNDIVLDNDGNEIPLREQVSFVNGEVLKVNGYGDVWKFKIDMPDFSESQCSNFYILMTRDWTSARHKVLKVEDGWLYYHLASEDLISDRNPNVDWMQYRVRPRYRLINSPASKGLHILNGMIYIPKEDKQVRVNKGGQLLAFAYCHFKTLDISGLDLNGCGGETVLGLYSSTFDDGAYIHDNYFTNMSSLSISAAYNQNVTIANNSIRNTRVQAISGGGTNTTIYGNHLNNIGWMLNTRAITGGGVRLHICDNVIENFNYSAIACGSTAANDEAPQLTYIIERNVVRLTKDYSDNYYENSLADGGGIYIGPQCQLGIIRNNVIDNITGIYGNRGIFLDDGAKNLAIYGNLIKNTANSYDIDLRLSNAYATKIPDHNTNNSVFHNIMTGGYRFQERGAGSNCVGGENLLLQTGKTQKTVVELKKRVADVLGNKNISTSVLLPIDDFVKGFVDVY